MKVKLEGAAGSACFSCTRCGVCCRDTLVPLTLEEALSWGKLTTNAPKQPEVGMSAQIMIWDPKDEGAMAEMMTADVLEWWRQRTSPARCGRMAVRVSLRLYAIISGECPHLRGNLCAAHDRRPAVCAAYPLEVNEPPSLKIVHPEATQCPSEAWASEYPLLINGVAVDGVESRSYRAYQAAWADEQEVLSHLREIVGLDVGGMPSDVEIVLPLALDGLDEAVAESRRRSATGKHKPNRWWKVYSIDPSSTRLLKKEGAFVSKAPPASALVIPGLLWRKEDGSVGETPGYPAA